jgi:UDPglucose 6-dehydrogenase
MDETKVAALRRGELPFSEPYLRKFINLAGSQLRFTTCSEEAIEAIGRHLGEGFTGAVNKSTVPVGSGNYAEVRYG